MAKVLEAVNEDDDLPNFKRATFQKIINDLNFKYQKRGVNSFLTDRDDVILWRRNYLRKIEQFRKEGRKIYYLDETWVNEGHVKSKVWVDNTVKSKKDAFLRGLSTGLKNPKGKGRRLIIAHIGSENGFVKNGNLIFQSKSNGDYHDEMNGEVFNHYFKSILPLLEDRCVIVLDNASYHCTKVEKVPNPTWRKADIFAWLSGKGINVDESYLKKELLALVDKEKSKYNQFVIDQLATEQNKIILRLPPYHCELNAIEMIWAQVKNHVAVHNTIFKMQDVRRLFEEGIDLVTEDKWEKCVSHVKEEEKNSGGSTI